MNASFTLILVKTTTPDLCSLSRLATLFRRSYGEVREAIDRAGVRPKLILDGVERYDAGDVRRALERPTTTRKAML